MQRNPQWPEPSDATAMRDAIRIAHPQIASDAKSSFFTGGAKTPPKKVRKLCFRPLRTILGHFRTFADIFSTFFGHFVDILFFWAVLSNDLPITKVLRDVPTLSGPQRSMQPRCAMRFESHTPKLLAMRNL